VHTEKYYNAESKDYWLSVGRVDKWKRIDLQIEAFRLMPSESLRIVGPVYPGYEYLKDSAPENVQFMNSVSGSELINLYAHSKGLIATAIDEDFGITPLEAMASGKPTVAVREGGYQETVIPWETGLLTDPTPEKLAEAINFAGMWRWYPQEIQQVARKFDYNIFKYFINKFISSVKDNSDRAV
jgi:glycosyltransferase involved in cell wall biosynthesis